jgi:hypothetical protein
MNGFGKFLTLFALSAVGAAAADTKVIESTRALHDAALQADPASVFWQDARAVHAERDLYANPVPGYRTRFVHDGRRTTATSYWFVLTKSCT